MALEIAERDLGGARVRMTFQTFLKDGTVRRFKARRNQGHAAR